MSSPRSYRRLAVSPAAVLASAVLTVVILTGAGTPTPAPTPAGVVAALDRSAHPLRSTEPGGDTSDLRPLGRMIGSAGVVGLGEATHGSHEFFTLQDRVFRYLVQDKGFGTFMREVNWGSGLRINDYVLHGRGDLRKIMREEFRGDYADWNTEEYERLFAWMRAYNAAHRDKVQYVGDDVYFPTTWIFDEIFRFVRPRRPELVQRLRGLYGALIPASNDEFVWVRRYHALPLARRQTLLRQATEAQRLIGTLRGGSDPSAADWAQQQARIAVWAARVHSTDDTDRELAYRDQGMADTTVWWYRHMRSKILLTAHNAHVGTTGLDRRHTIRRQGALLRDTLGRDYVPIGLTFSQGSLYAHPARGRTDTIERFTTGPPPPDDIEYVLDQVRFPDYYLDLRTVGPPARAWLDRRWRVRSIGAEYPEAEDVISPPRTYDILIHIRRITAARFLHSPDLRTLSPAPRPPASPPHTGGAPGAGAGWRALPAGPVSSPIPAPAFTL